MYKKLLPFINKYLMIETTVNNSVICYKGQLLEVTPDTFDIQTYGDHGEPEGLYIGLTQTVTSVQTDSRELRELSLKIKFHTSDIEPIEPEMDVDDVNSQIA